jgi:hypothetical protein
MDLRKIGWGCVAWINLAQDRDRWWALANAVMNLWVLAPLSLLVSFTCIQKVIQRIIMHYRLRTATNDNHVIARRVYILNIDTATLQKVCGKHYDYLLIHVSLQLS